MQHIADTATVSLGSASAVTAREKRQREEPQLSSAEHVPQLGSATPVQLGSAEHV